MSFSVTISGHSSKHHDEAVLKAVAAAKAELEKVEGLTGSIGGYTWSSGGEESRVTINETLAGPTEAPVA